MPAVWLIELGGPERPEAARDWLTRRLRAPGALRLPAGLGWARAWIAAALAWWRCRALVPAVRRLEGPPPELGAVPALATRLQQELGGRYNVQPVLLGARPGPADAAAALRDEGAVVLIPLCPLPAKLPPELAGPLRAKRAKVARAGAWLGGPGWVELAARGARRELAGLGGAAKGAATVFAVRAGAGEAGRAAAAALARALGRPPVIWEIPDAHDPPARGAAEALRPLAVGGPRPLVVVPVGFSADHLAARLALGAALQGPAAALGLGPCIPISPIGDDPDFFRLLAQAARAAEREAGWPVPEDAVRDEIEAALRGAGHTPLRRELG
jgi:hypothetical protein